MNLLGADEKKIKSLHKETENVKKKKGGGQLRYTEYSLQSAERLF